MTSLIITLTFLLRCSGNKLEEDYKKLKDKYKNQTSLVDSGWNEM